MTAAKTTAHKPVEGVQALNAIHQALDRIGGDMALLVKLARASIEYEPEGDDPALDERFWRGLETMAQRVLDDLSAIHAAGEVLEGTAGGAR